MTPRPRDVVIVIDKILELIPPNNESMLINELEEFKESLWNKAPEVRKYRDSFLPVQQILSRHISTIDEAWKMEVLHIFNTN